MNTSKQITVYEAPLEGEVMSAEEALGRMAQKLLDDDFARMLYNTPGTYYGKFVREMQAKKWTRGK